jgi:hypothetical protein
MSPLVTTTRIRRAVAGAIAVTLALAPAGAPAAAAPPSSYTSWTWSVAALPGLPGGGAANVTGSDGNGVLYGTANDADGHPHLVSWRNGVLTDLDGTYNWATGLGNSNGIVAGTIAPPNGTHHAAELVDGRVQLLPEPDGTLSTGVTAIDESGNLVGQASGFDWQVHAVMWPAGQPRVPKSLSVPPGMGSGGAFGIGSAAMSASHGRIVGYAGVSGYIWNTDGSIRATVLPTSPGDALDLQATSDGAVIGTEWVEAEGVNHAVEVGSDLEATMLPGSQGTVAFTGNARIVGGQDSASLQAIAWVNGKKTTLPVPAGTFAGFPRVTAGPRMLAGSILDATFTERPVKWVLTPGNV